MSASRWLRAQWPYLLAASGLGSLVAVAIATRPRVGPASEFVPPSVPSSVPRAWVLLEGSPVRLVQGRRYRGCVSVPWIVPAGLVAGKLPAALADRGFVDVAVTRDWPSDWPHVACDIFVEATWARPSEDMDRPGAVSFAWRGEPIASA